MKKLVLFAILFIATNNLLNAQIDSGLIAKFSFNDQNTLDESTVGNDATGYNLTPATDRFGAPDKAYAFKDSSYMTLPNGILNIYKLSISVWFKTESNEGAIVGHQSSAAGTTPSQYVPIAYVVDTDSTLNAAFWNGGTGNTNNTNLTVNDGEWHHLVIVGGNASQSVYLDNVLTGTRTGYSILSSMIYAQFGTAYVAGGWPGNGTGYSYFDGSLDDIRIYDRVISAADVDSLFNETVQLVESITVTGQGGNSTITTIGGSLQMEAAILPLNAHNDAYTWSVTNGTGSATISVAGLLTASADGTVTVTATANDDSGETGTKTITISNQTTNPGTGINDLAFENVSVFPNPTNRIINLNISETLSSIRIM
ncbi:MAG: LamG-like jellyroll fold domain-containing protein, partial [Chitinophagales bacterium]